MAREFRGTEGAPVEVLVQYNAVGVACCVAGGQVEHPHSAVGLGGGCVAPGACVPGREAMWLWKCTWYSGE